MSAKALNAILPLIASGQAYEAHQKARTFAARYSKSSAYDTAIDVLFQSSRELLKAGHYGSGVDLGTYLLEIYDLKGEPINSESRGRLTQLIALTGPSDTWRKTLIDKSILWSAKNGPNPSGDPDLHHYIGELLYKEGSFSEAEPHLLAAGQRDSARIFAQMFFEWSRNGADPGKYAARGTIPYLLSGNVLASRAFLNHFLSLVVSSRPQILHEPTPISIPSAGVDDQSKAEDDIYLTNDSILNFLQLAIRLCQRARGKSGEKEKQARDAWIRLCNAYTSKGGLIGSNEFRKALTSLSQLYFGIQPPRSQNINPLQDMMSSFLGGPAPAAAAKPRMLPLPSNAALD